VHYLLNRRWREAFTAIGTAVGVTLGAWLLLPEASFTVWGGGLHDPARRGPDGLLGDAIWLLLVAIVGFIGFSLARRAHRLGDSISEVAAVGLMAVLLSPVAWIHHLHWMVVVVFAVLGANPLRDRRRIAAAALITGFFLCRMPWWGITWLSHPDWPDLPGRMLQNSDVFFALTALGLLWWALHLPEPGTGPDLPDAADSARPARDSPPATDSRTTAGSPGVPS
jgi:alpha-1,2-mannosyltransferase